MLFRSVDVVTKPVEKNRLFACIARHVLGEGAASKAVVDDGAVRTYSQVLDPAAIAALAEDLGEDGARKAMTTFLTHTAKQIDAIPGLIAIPERLRIEVHSIKGAARLIGAGQLAFRAATLESKLARGGNAQTSEIEELREAFEAFHAAVKRDPRLAKLAKSVA